MFAHTRILTRYVRLPIVIQIANVLNLHFKVKESNGIHIKCIMHLSVQAYRHGLGRYGADGRYQSLRFQGVSGMEVDYLWSRYVNGC